MKNILIPGDEAPTYDGRRLVAFIHFEDGDGQAGMHFRAYWFDTTTVDRGIDSDLAAQRRELGATVMASRTYDIAIMDDGIIFCVFAPYDGEEWLGAFPQFAQTYCPNLASLIEAAESRPRPNMVSADEYAWRDNDLKIAGIVDIGQVEFRARVLACRLGGYRRRSITNWTVDTHEWRYLVIHHDGAITLHADSTLNTLMERTE